MPFTSHNIVHSVNPSAPRSNNAAPARPPVPMYTNDDVARAPQYPNTDGRANINNNANANDRQNPNGNERATPNGRLPANDATQQHPAVKFTPPTKAKDADYDVHPPLNHNATTPAPAAHQQAPAWH